MSVSMSGDYAATAAGPVPQTKALKFTGLDQAPMIPTGARVVGAYWVLAESYGPGEARSSEAAAIRAGIVRHEKRLAERQPYNTGRPPERFCVDLRWKMEWDQGAATDATGRRSSSSGMDFTVRRTHYESIAEAHAHLDRLERHAPAEPGPDTLDRYFVAPDAHDDDYVWREDGDHPVPVLGKVPVLREHPALWEAIVNLVGRKDA